MTAFQSSRSSWQTKGQQSGSGYASSVPRPSRQEEAKTAIDAYYAEHGVMPTIKMLAQVMGYRSTASAHATVMALVKTGYLGQEDRGGRLLPGAGFTRTTRAATASTPEPGIPAEILKCLPADVELMVFTVPVRSLVDRAILEGDHLVLAPQERTDLSSHLLLSRGAVLSIGSRPKLGWKTLGVLMAQFRSYR